MAIVLYVLGSACILIGSLLAAFGEGGAGVMAGGGVIISGVIFLGFGSALDTLNRIESHLHVLRTVARPEEEKKNAGAYDVI